MSTYKHVLIATDLTPENDPVIKKSVELAKAFGATVSMVHVVEPLPGYGYAYVGVADIESQLVDEAKEAMNKLAKKYGLEEKHCFVEVGPTKTQVMKIAEDEKIDLIMLGSHGRHGIAELLGSTAHSVVHGAPCDVLTVKIAG